MNKEKKKIRLIEKSNKRRAKERRKNRLFRFPFDVNYLNVSI